MEELYAEFLLWDNGFTTNERYNHLLDAQFLQEGAEAILLELEMCSADQMATWRQFAAYWLRHELDVAVFEQKLLAALQRTYDQQTFSTAAFSSHCYRLWLALPEVCASKLPFVMLYDIDEYPYALDEGLQAERLATFFAFGV